MLILMACCFWDLLNTVEFWTEVLEETEQPIAKSLPQGSILWPVLFNSFLYYMDAGG